MGHKDLKALLALSVHKVQWGNRDRLGLKDRLVLLVLPVRKVQRVWPDR